MADGYNFGQAGTMSPEEFAQQQQLNRQQQMAALLMQQGQKPAQGQMISGRFVAPSFFQNITPLVQTALGSYLGGKADTEAAKLANAIRENKADIEQQIISKLTPQPARSEELAGPAYKGVAPSIQYPEQGPDYAGALQMINMNPYGAGKEMRAEILKKQLGPEDTADYRNFLKVKAEGFKGTFNDYQDLEANRKRPVTNLSVNMPSETERKAGTMVNILDKNLQQMQTALGVDPSAVKPNVPASVVEAITGPNLLSRTMKPAQRQVIEDSQLDILDAALTLRTGAAYTREQLVGMRDTYFPKLGDKPATIEAKKQRLDNFIPRPSSQKIGPESWHTTYLPHYASTA
jgi:hypothetical protein